MATFNMGNGNVTVTKYVNKSTIRAGNGNDIITIIGNQNITFIGNGHNTLSIQGNNNILKVGDGNDKIFIQGNGNLVYAGNGNDTVTVKGNKDITTVGNGNDTVIVIGNNDTTIIGNGNDCITIIGNQDTTVVGNGNDVISIQGNNNILKMGCGNDKITIQGNENVVYAGKGNDILKVSGINNFILDAGGNNYFMDTGTGSILKSGSGLDTFVYNPNDKWVDGGLGFNTLLITCKMATPIDLTHSLTHMDHIQMIDLTGNGLANTAGFGNTLTLNYNVVGQMVGNGNNCTMIVLAGYKDILNLGAGWTNVTPAHVQPLVEHEMLLNSWGVLVNTTVTLTDYLVYKHGNQTLIVDQTHDPGVPPTANNVSISKTEVDPVQSLNLVSLMGAFDPDGTSVHVQSVNTGVGNLIYTLTGDVLTFDPLQFESLGPGGASNSILTVTFTDGSGATTVNALTINGHDIAVVPTSINLNGNDLATNDSINLSVSGTIIDLGALTPILAGIAPATEQILYSLSGPAASIFHVDGQNHLVSNSPLVAGTYQVTVNQTAVEGPYIINTLSDAITITIIPPPVAQDATVTIAEDAGIQNLDLSQLMHAFGSGIHVQSISLVDHSVPLTQTLSGDILSFNPHQFSTLAPLQQSNTQLNVTFVDASHATVTKMLDLFIEGAYQAPSAITLSNHILFSLAFTPISGVVIGYLNTVDAVGDNLNVTLSTSTPGFEIINGHELKVIDGYSGFDHLPTGQSITVHVIATDSANVSITQDLVLSVISPQKTYIGDFSYADLPSTNSAYVHGVSSSGEDQGLFGLDGQAVPVNFYMAGAENGSAGAYNHFFLAPESNNDATSGNNIVVMGVGKNIVEADTIEQFVGSQVIYNLNYIVGGTGDMTFLVNSSLIMNTQTRPFESIIQGGTGFNTLDIIDGGGGILERVFDFTSPHLIPITNIEDIQLSGKNTFTQKLILDYDAVKNLSPINHTVTIENTPSTGPYDSTYNQDYMTSQSNHNLSTKVVDLIHGGWSTGIDLGNGYSSYTNHDLTLIIQQTIHVVYN